MSTRANIIFKDKVATLYFYRHSDGYPDVTGADLKEFCTYYYKHMRKDAMQSAGWLIVHGYQTMKTDDMAFTRRYGSQSTGTEWKVGYYEPTSDIHGDVEYIYVIDLDAMILETREPTTKFYNKPSLANTKVIETYSISENPGIIAKGIVK